MAYIDSVDAVGGMVSSSLQCLGTRPRCDRPPVGAQV
ncbi:MAG: hypothetical protein QOJ57_1679 [Thermoleophilaceae bacterium]|jgi:hypothetical protein|nr:hypothetical protein [Thermoleophilaceae bacterium]